MTTINGSQANSTVDDQHSNNNDVPGSGGFITKVTADVIRSAINCYLLPPVVLFGWIGNVLSLIILGGKKMRQYSTNIVLAYLAFIDTLLLLIAFMRKMPCLVGKADPLTAQTIDYVMLTAPLILELIASRTSSLLSLVICCERFIAVFKPLKVKLWVTPKRMIFSVF
ncbi:FMRFamide peptide receptor frpr-18-like [Patella vulgata]|uniref:FMRFamide peptide receptor frpr-18-like n=1 Tax=Patella vulgata TaxID=6465 RepID=UPI0024A8A1D1|nr:FMRFamide peptide receptor frpr-18-like [Patella vulgata]